MLGNDLIDRVAGPNIGACRLLRLLGAQECGRNPVIGACLAYFLASRGAEVVVIERSALACAASGKSGGFLALDWCDGSPLEALARRSFALHVNR